MQSVSFHETRSNAKWLKCVAVVLKLALAVQSKINFHVLFLHDFFSVVKMNVTQIFQIPVSVSYRHHVPAATLLCLNVYCQYVLSSMANFNKFPSELWLV